MRIVRQLVVPILLVMRGAALGAETAPPPPTSPAVPPAAVPAPGSPDARSPAPAPQPMLWHLTPGQEFWYVAQLEWAFSSNLDPQPAAVISQIIPDRLIERVLYRATVTTLVDGCATIGVHPEWVWRTWPNFGGELKGVSILAANGVVKNEDYEGLLVGSTAGPKGRANITIDGQQAGTDLSPLEADMGMNLALDALGVPGLVVPLGSAARPPRLNFPFGVSAGGCIDHGLQADGLRHLTATWPNITGTRKDVITSTIALFHAVIAVSVSFTCEGSGTAEVGWDEVRSMAATADSSWRFKTTLTIAQVGGGLRLIIPGTASFTRSAQLIVDGRQNHAPVLDLAGAMAELMHHDLPVMQRRWADPTSTPINHAMSFAELKDFAELPSLSPWSSTMVEAGHL